jgi:hypothetical protein
MPTVRRLSRIPERAGLELPKEASIAHPGSSVMREAKQEKTAERSLSLIGERTDAPGRQGPFSRAQHSQLGTDHQPRGEGFRDGSPRQA